MPGSLVNRTHAVLLSLIAGCLLISACVEPETPPQACRDLADTVATQAAAECGDDYDTVYDQFVDAAAGGDCSNIVGIRDRGELYDDCIPRLESSTCDDLQMGNLPASCNAQLLR